MTDQAFVQVVMFRHKDHVLESDVLAVAAAMKTDLASVDGCIRWELLKADDGRWVEFIYWDSQEAAQRGNETVMAFSSAQRAFEITDDSTVTVLNLNQVDVPL
jgi:heme-degrading monooxygenase HmoA